MKYFGFCVWWNGIIGIFVLSAQQHHCLCVSNVDGDMFMSCTQMTQKHATRADNHSD